MEEAVAGPVREAYENQRQAAQTEETARLRQGAAAETYVALRLAKAAEVLARPCHAASRVGDLRPLRGWRFTVLAGSAVLREKVLDIDAVPEYRLGDRPGQAPVRRGS